MALESELKFRDVDFESVRENLLKAGGSCKGRYFERNLVFDDDQRSLKQKMTLLRLRQKPGEAVLTVKHPPEVETDSRVKVFEEIQTVVADFEAMKKALEIVGFHVAFSYEKVREKWKAAGCEVCLDQMPFGLFMEIEGEPDALVALAESLGLDPENGLKATYHELNREHRANHGLPEDESFVFSPQQLGDLQI